MSLQHSTDQREAKGESRGLIKQAGIVVPSELGALRILKQDLREDGSIEVEGSRRQTGRDAHIVNG